ncbi:hypothetical protein [Thiohalophilus sp.]|uniref:hypothetical protein n=1 Tax=Thiohalophilus sp. TaxID=3028392 RepID=UPI002ACE5006|nr:hypothetical protein [Thiohalophilus sp.]MDZ7803155.1 hypothetical protein [Thiohalophilus sp.]
MQKLFTSISAVSLLAVSITVVHAAPVTLPSGATGIQGTLHEGKDGRFKAQVGLGFTRDFIDEIELKDYEGEVEGNINTFRLIYSVADRVDLYLDFGAAQDMEYRASLSNGDVTFELEDEIVWGAGLAFVVYQDKGGLAINADLRYRTIQEMGYDSVTVNGTAYTHDQVDVDAEAQYEEWHAALGMSYNLGFMTPYAGVKFVGNDYSATATAGGSTYDFGSTESDKIMGGFAGITMLPSDRLAIDVQGRFVDEEAISASLTFMF